MTHLTECDFSRAQEIFAMVPCRKELRILEIAQEVADATGIPVNLILGNSRLPHIAHARQLAYFIALRNDFSTVEIGRAFNKDHTAVMHGVRAEAIRRGQE